ncbi:prolyl oligopeptidase family serine peptidase [Microbacterium yannicii]|uniref:prolyl oligopeptidase family serine peptidase n=1 Tax=Microbacterium yannicii TaxID=671622 RepID=UPI00031AD21E|nr:prolyl oligopeptidase family serine peptidase [Microbacterium yannicii]
MSPLSIRAGLAIAASVALTLSAAPASAAPPPEASELRGVLPGGGQYVVHQPAQWSGTLLTWSPGYGGGGGVASAGPSPEVVTWLTSQGYALAGAAAGSGWAVEDLLVAQPQVVDAAEAALGEAEHVVAWGSSMGGQVSVALLEQQPDVFDAALPLCGSIAGAIPMLNGSLDGTYALKTLLAPADARLELARVTNEPARQAAFKEVLDAAQQTPEGRARIALAASLAQMPTWSQPGTEKPGRNDLDAQQEQLYRIFMWGAVSPRQPLEQRAGGNFSWNTGVDYAEALRASGQLSLVRQLYRAAGLSLDEDLGALNGGERIMADAGAVAYMQKNATPTGDIDGPVLSLHETGDAAPVVAQAGSYADRVRENRASSLIEQVFVDRPGHCDYADAEVAALVTALQDRLDSGKWKNLASPRALDKRADAIAETTGLERGGAFVRYAPGSVVRPEREPEVYAPAPSELTTHEGVLPDGSAFTAIAPGDWDGSLVVVPGRATAQFASAEWLLQRGSALIGYDLSDGWDLVRDRDNAGVAVATFSELVGTPDDVVLAGRSQGGLVTRIVADSAPDWLDGAVPMCGGGAGAVSTWNYKLDTAFVLRELVDPESTMRITGIVDLDAEIGALNGLVAKASETPEGRARAAFAAAMSKIPALDPATGTDITDRAARIDRYLEYLPFAVGTHVRAGYEDTAGGTFSWNTGVDYRRALRESGRWNEVAAAYRDAGLSLDEDLRTLAGATRLAADPAVVGFVEQTASFTGELRVPVLSLSTSGDGAGSTQDDEAYEATVREAGERAQLNQAFVQAEGHCTFTAAEEAAAFETMFTRIGEGSWPSTSPRALVERAEWLDDRSEFELGGARFDRAQHGGAPARMWDADDWGTYRG